MNKRVKPMVNRMPPDAITYAWGLTEAQWHERVRDAVARADAAEAECERLRFGGVTMRNKFEEEAAKDEPAVYVSFRSSPPEPPGETKP